MSILEKIIEQKKMEIAALDASALRRAVDSSPTPRDFLAALKRRRFSPRPSLIAELKRASPSKGLLAPHLDLFQVADLYTQNGASAISVLTDEKFFMGKPETLRELRFTRKSELPLLRKDFIIELVQLYETKVMGADAVLLIVAAMKYDKQLFDLHALALELGLTPLVEVHDEAETERALKIPNIQLIGINNRNLATFEVSLTTTERLRPMIPADREIMILAGFDAYTRLASFQRIAGEATDRCVITPQCWHRPPRPCRPCGFRGHAVAPHRPSSSGARQGRR